MIMSLCDIPEVLKVMKLVKLVLMIIKIVVPIILVITGMISFMQAITKENDGLNDALKLFVKRAIAALLIFFVPTFVNIIVKAITPENPYVQCFNYEGTTEEAYMARIESLIKNARENKSISAINQAKSYLSKISDGAKRQKYEKEINEIENIINNTQNQNIIDPSKVNHIVINTPYTQIKKGESTTINIAIVPNSATDKEVEWKSSDSSIIEVDQNGKITAKSVGTAIITVTLKSDNTISKSLTITVLGENSKTSTFVGAISMNIGDSLNLIPNTSVEMEWSSSNTSVATVSSKGQVKAIKKGAAVITAKYNGTVSSTTSIIVLGSSLHDSYEGNYLKYYIEKPASNYIVTRLWVQDAYNQIRSTYPYEMTSKINSTREFNVNANACFENKNRGYKMYRLVAAKTILNDEIGNKGYSNTALVAINGSGMVMDGFFPATTPCSSMFLPPIPYIVKNNVVIKDVTNGVNPTPTNSAFGIKPSGIIGRYWFTDGSTAENIQFNKTKVSEIKKDKLRDTFQYGVTLVENGKLATSDKGATRAERQGFCQIDKNNFIIISSIMETDEQRYTLGLRIDELAQIMLDYGCQTGLNLDGGGSEVFYYKKNNSEIKNVLVNGKMSYANRGLTDLLYFVDKSF